MHDLTTSGTFISFGKLSSLRDYYRHQSILASKFGSIPNKSGAKYLVLLEKSKFETRPNKSGGKYLVLFGKSNFETRPNKSGAIYTLLLYTQYGFIRNTLIRNG